MTNNKNVRLCLDEKHRRVTQSQDQFFVGFPTYELPFGLAKILQTKIFMHRLYFKYRPISSLANFIFQQDACILCD